MRVLIMGATGLLGRVLLKEWDSDQVIGVGSREAGIRDEAQLLNLFARCKPEWTVLAAAYTDVDGCERNPELAHQVNCVGATSVARLARASGSRLMLISTDYVFDGAKSTPYDVDDPVCPLNVYGRSKADAERRVQEVLPDCCILRTSWLFGAQAKCFPKAILAMAQEQKELSVVADQTGSPTFNRDLARAIVKLVRANAKGTIHATNSGECTWFEFAQEIIRVAGLVDVVIKPISTEDLKRPALRPKYSVLSNASLHKFGLSMRDWRETLRDYFEEDLGIAHASEKATCPH